MEKKKESSAFEQKCAAATEKIMKSHKSYLLEDMQRMLNEADETYADVQILLSGTSIMLHSCVIQARCDGLWEWLSEVGQCTEGVTVVSLYQILSSEETQAVLDNFRALYTEDDVAPALQNLQAFICQHPTNESQPWLDAANQTVVQSGTVHSTISWTGYFANGRNSNLFSHTDTVRYIDVSSQVAVDGTFRHDFDNNIHEISENITNTSLDKAKKETRFLSQFSENLEQSQSDEDCNNCVDFMGSNNGIVQHNFSDSIGGDFESNRLCCNHAGERDEKELSNSLEFVYKQKAQELVKKVIVDAKKMVTSCYTNVCIDNSSHALNGFELETTGSESSPSVLLTEMEKKDDLTDADMQSCKDCDTSSSVNNWLMIHAENINASNIEPRCIAEKRGQVLRLKDSSAGMQALLEKQLGVLRRVEACCKLGEDLLRMLLEETDCDFVIEVNGTRIRAHRSVLSTRSEYFGAMLSNCWRETDSQMMCIEGASVADVWQMLLYIYGGCVDIDQRVEMHSMAKLADMYALDRLRDIVTFNLTRDYCHFFHKPCKECTKQVPYALACAASFNMPDLRDKCVKWINKHLAQVWNTKELLTLPREMLEMCLKVAVDDLSVDTVLDTLLTCCQLNEKTPRSIKWIEPMFGMIEDLKEAAIKFASSNFVNLISNTNLRRLDERSLTFNKQPIEDIFTLIIKTLSPDMACRAYLAVHKWVKTIETLRNDTESAKTFSEEFESLIENLFRTCEEQLCTNIQLVVDTAEWDLLSADMRDTVKQNAGYIQIGSTKPKMGRPKLSSDNRKKTSAEKGMSIKEYFECHTGHLQIPQPAKERHDKSHHNTQSHRKTQVIKSGSTETKTRRKEKRKSVETISDTQKRNKSTFKSLKVKKPSQENGIETEENESNCSADEVVLLQPNGCLIDIGEVAVDIDAIEPFQRPDPIVFEPDILLPSFEVTFTIG